MTAQGALITEETRSDGNRSLLRLILGLGLLLPAMFACGVQFLMPTIATLITSLQNARFQGPVEFVGLANYTSLLEGEALGPAVGFTLLLVVERLALVAVLPMLLALGVNALGRGGQRLVRVLFTLPVAVYLPVMAAMAWRVLLQPVGGLQIGPVLTDPTRAPLTILLIDGLSFGALALGIGLVIYLAALRGRGPEEPLSRRFGPLAAAWIIMAVTSVALALQSFTLSFLLTRGGPARATQTLMLLFYDFSFRNMTFGRGAAVAVLLLLLLSMLGLAVGLVVVVARLRLDVADRRPEPRPGWGYLLLALAGLAGGLLCLFSVLPIPWAMVGGLGEQAAAELDRYAPFARTLANTLLPLLGGVFLVQMPLTYLGALGIGAMRPLGRWSELLLLPFSPWLFVTAGPLSVVLFQKLAEAGQLNTLSALAPPFALSVPALFALTLLFKGLAPRFQTARADGAGALPAFWRTLLLPSLPFSLLLGLLLVFMGLQDLLWPLVAVSRPDQFPINVALAALLGQFSLGQGLAAGLLRFGLPLMAFFFLVFSLFQVLYLDALRLAAGEQA